MMRSNKNCWIVAMIAISLPFFLGSMVVALCSIFSLSILRNPLHKESAFTPVDRVH